MFLFEGTLAIPTVVLVQHMPTSRLIPLLRKSFSFMSLFKLNALYDCFSSSVFPPQSEQMFRLIAECSAGSAIVVKRVSEMVFLLSFSRRVFILGPSHHVHLSCCGLSPAEIYRTPLYDLKIDQKGIWFVLECCNFHFNV